MPPDLALLSTLTGSNYPCLELILMVPKVFEPLKFYCTYMYIHHVKFLCQEVAIFLTYETEFVLFLAVLENFVMPMG